MEVCYQRSQLVGPAKKNSQTILIFQLLTISRIFRLKLTKIRDYMRYVCIQFMAVTLWSIELYSDTQEYKKVTKKNARKCSIEIRRVEFYFFRPKRTSSRQMLAKTSFFIYVLFKTSTKSWPETTIQNPSNGGYDAKKCVYKNDK